MKTLTLNLLKYNPTNEDPLELTEFDFWKYYLDLLQVKAGRFLSEKESDVLSYVLSGDINVSYFKSPNSKPIKEKLGLSTIYFHKVKESLLKKGIIEPTGIRGDYTLSKKFITFQKYMKSHLNNGYDIEFKFKFRKNENKD